MGSLEILLVIIRSKQKTELVPIYTPPEEISSKAIAKEWEKLDKNILDYEKVLLDKNMLDYEKVLKEIIGRMKKLEALLDRFKTGSESVDNWHKSKQNFLNEV